VVGAITALAYLVLALAISVPLTLLVLATGAGLTWLLAGRRRVAVRQGSRIVAAEEALHRAIGESLASMKLIRTASAEDRQIAGFDATARELRDAHVELGSSPSAVNGWFSAGTAAILSLVVYVAIQHFGMAAAELAVLLVVFWRLSPRMTAIQVSYHVVLGGLPAYEAVAALDSRFRAATRRRSAPRADLAYRRAVELTHISFHYDRERPVLSDVSLTIAAGQTVAVVGSSGAGKSTLADLVLGLLQPTTGRIAIDGIELTPENLDAWHRQVAYVPQDPFLFHDTIRANLRWAAPEADEAAMREALQAAAGGFVLDLPDGLDTIVGDRGVLLSGGERQRIAIARALLRRPALLVLDEATSSLDSENEALIRGAIERLHGRTAILVISHRLSTVRNADVIYVLEDGRVVETGRFEELSLRPAGRFRSLWRAQAEALEEDSEGPPERRIARS
jgi:ATP-binding cassette subfamily C protein